MKYDRRSCTIMNHWLQLVSSLIIKKTVTVLKCIRHWKGAFPAPNYPGIQKWQTINLTNQPDIQAPILVLELHNLTRTGKSSSITSSRCALLVNWTCKIVILWPLIFSFSFFFWKSISIGVHRDKLGAIAILEPKITTLTCCPIEPNKRQQ